MGKLPKEWQPYVDQLEQRTKELEAEVERLQAALERVKALQRYQYSVLGDTATWRGSEWMLAADVLEAAALEKDDG